METQETADGGILSKTQVIKGIAGFADKASFSLLYFANIIVVRVFLWYRRVPPALCILKREDADNNLKSVERERIRESSGWSDKWSSTWSINPVAFRRYRLTRWVLAYWKMHASLNVDHFLPFLYNIITVHTYNRIVFLNDWTESNALLGTNVFENIVIKSSIGWG